MDYGRSDDEIWNIVSKLFSVLNEYSKLNVYFRFINLNRVFILNNKVIIDCVEGFDVERERHFPLVEKINSDFLRHCSGSQDLLIPPELLRNGSINRSTNVWFLGNIIYFCFEVRSSEETAVRVPVDRQSAETVPELPDHQPILRVHRKQIDPRIRPEDGPGGSQGEDRLAQHLPLLQ